MCYSGKCLNERSDGECGNSNAPCPALMDDIPDMQWSDWSLYEFRPKWILHVDAEKVVILEGE